MFTRTVGGRGALQATKLLSVNFIPDIFNQPPYHKIFKHFGEARCKRDRSYEGIKCDLKGRKHCLQESEYKSYLGRKP